MTIDELFRKYVRNNTAQVSAQDVARWSIILGVARQSDDPVQAVQAYMLDAMNDVYRSALARVAQEFLDQFIDTTATTEKALRA